MPTAEDRFKFAQTIIAVPLLIAAGGPVLTPLIDLGGGSLVAIRFPASMDATNYTLHGAASKDASLVPLVNDSGLALQLVVSSNSLVILTAGDLVCVQWLAFLPNAPESGDRQLELMVRPVQ